MIWQAVRKSGITEIEVEQERLHSEKDLVLEGTDFYVTRDGSDVHRGDYLAVGGPLQVTGMRIIHPGTIVSPADDKFFVRDLRFVRRDIRGPELIWPADIRGDPDVGGFWHLQVLHGRDPVGVCGPVHDRDGSGPGVLSAAGLQQVQDRPRNVRFHSDGLVDPEGRWDNDLGVWVTWDPSFDTQQGVVGYHVEVSGPAYKGEFYTAGLSMDLTFPEAGTYVVMVRGEDESGNIGLPGSARIVVDMSEIRLVDAGPSYHGGVWYKDSGMEVLVTVDDVVPSSVGPGIDLSTLGVCVDR
ncbi:MAG: hypothetical protein MZV70_77070 [Desulfobacterales bacterium]|nr:hypothetical protein [Desulfobacterales bacterium]